MLPEALRLLRVFHDLKQRELAAELGLSNSHISELESGNRTPSLEVIEKYGAFFGVPVSSILFFSERLEDQKTRQASLSRTKQAIASKIIGFLKVVEERTEANGA